jgi:hypothetical protein
LKYAAGLISGDLPAWLSFNAATRTFSGTPASEDRGFYNVVVTAFDRDMEFTTDTFEVHITGPLGITDLADEWNLNVYPNPTDGIFYVNIDLPEIEDVELKIYTPVGRLVLNEKYRHQLGNTRLSVNLTGYKKGMYIVQIATKSGVASKQIILR